MRFFPSLIGVCLAVGAFAQDKTFAGTKSDVIKTSTQSPQGMSMMPFFQLMVALGIVLLVLKFVLPKFVTKLNKRLVTSGNGIKVEESAAFAGGNLYIVNARGKTLLLSVATSGVSCLADLTPAEPPATLPPSFLEILENVQLEQPAAAPATALEVFQPQESQAPQEIPVAQEMLLEDVHRLLEEARARREQPDMVTEAVVEDVVFKTRLPENTKPLPSVTPEPLPWQPRRVERVPAEELEDTLRRLEQLSS